MESLVPLCDLIETAPFIERTRLSKSEKREARRNEMRESRKYKRKLAIRKRRIQDREERTVLLNSMTTEERIEYIHKERYFLENRTAIAQRQLTEACGAQLLSVCISLDFMQYMSEKEKRSLAQQLGYVYKSLLRNDHYLAKVIVSSYNSSMDEHVQYYGNAFWGHLTTTDHVLEIYNERFSDLIVLSPDADTPLNEAEIFDTQNIFVIGGIVDRSVRKNETRSFAQVNGLRCRHLPIRQVLGPKAHPVLNINTVTDILFAVRFDGLNLSTALAKHIPIRKQRFLEDSTTRKADSYDGQLQDGVLQHGSPRGGQPPQASAKDVNLRDETSRESSPRAGQPQDRKPQEGSSGENTPQEGTVQHGTPRHKTPKDSDGS